MSEGALRGPLEAILMVAAEPVTAEEVAVALGVDAREVEQELNALAREYAGEDDAEARGFELRRVAGGWRIYSARRYADAVGRFVVGSAHARLSRICKIRGVNVDGVVRTLLARGLVEETGTTPSGAHLYGTTTEFLEKMGMSSLSELLPLAPYLPEADALIELEEEL